MTILIESPTALNRDTFDGSGSLIEDDIEALQVDLRRCQFIDQYAMVTLLTVMTLHARDGNDVQLQLPDRGATRTYMARMRFFSLLHPGVFMDHDPPEVAEHARPLLELAPINIGAGERVIEELCEFARPQLPRHLRAPFVEALAEIGSNVIFHSDAEVGYVCAQRFTSQYQRRRPPRLQIVVGDAGMGIRASLSRADPELEMAADTTAIREAVREGVTSRPGTHSGVGLSTVRRYADMFGGVLHIRSGQGVLIRRGKKYRARTVPGLPGTIVAVELASPGRRR